MRELAVNELNLVAGGSNADCGPASAATVLKAVQTASNSDLQKLREAEVKDVDSSFALTDGQLG